MFEVASDDIIFRLDTNFNPKSRDLYIKHEDLPTIINTFCDHNQMHQELKMRIHEHIVENVSQINYNILSELAVLYASKMDKHYRNLFFKTHKEKFMKDLPHLDSENFYKIIWGFVKAKELEST